MKEIIVICRSKGEQIALYRFSIPAATPPGAPVDEREIIGAAKSQLAIERIAAPPYGGIEFDVIYPS